MTSTELTFDQALQSASELLATDAAAALDRANRLVEQRPDPRAFRIAASALRKLGRNEEAIRAELEGIRFGFTPPLQSARAAQQERRSAQAKSIAEDYLKSNPDDLLAMTIAAEADLGLNRIDEAEPILRRVIERAPPFLPANMLLASALVAQLRLREAAEVLEKLARRAPHEMNAKRFLGDVRAQMNDPFGAAALYEEVVASPSVNPADEYKLAQNLRAAGRREESIAALRRSIAHAPLSAHAWWTLAFYFPESLSAGDEAQMRAAIANPNIANDDRRLLGVAISVLEHRRGNHEATMEAISSAKALPSRTPPYDPDVLTRHVDELIAAYTPELFQRFAPLTSKSDAPIFIVGLPRSGSTLVERILSQHSQIEAVGEIPVMPRVVGSEQPDDAAKYRSLLPQNLTAEKLAEMAAWYLERSREYRHTDRPHFTDKYNGNWIRSGLIGLMFPRGKVLDVRRDPLDCCWSVFKTMFADDYARDQRHLARYYADYVRFMDATAAASPGTILTISYEDIVNNIEGQTRRMLDFLGLEFEPACVDFHLSAAPVTTPSSEQVRRPINSEGIGSAEPYRRWLQPLIEELESALGTGFDRPSRKQRDQA